MSNHCINLRPEVTPFSYIVKEISEVEWFAALVIYQKSKEATK